MRKRRRMPNDDAMQFGELNPILPRASSISDSGIYYTRRNRRLRRALEIAGSAVLCIAAALVFGAVLVLLLEALS